ncbi:Ig-like domain-containing protein [Candidatus Peregrinibacteria bacterium]|nr:MAG: Ig-like domain-containing protein [Candidatus Peregrinibacteria bacterium]
MKKEIYSTARGSIRIGGILLASIFLLATPTHGFFDEKIEQILAESDSGVVEGLLGTPGNGKVILIWNTTYDTEGEEATKYRIEYGPTSVEAGTSEEYEFFLETEDNLPSAKVDDLANGTTYYFRVIGIFADKSESLPSQEISVKPVGDMQQQFSESPVVISAETTGSKTLLVFFSEEIILPSSTPELAFSITEEEGSQNSITVESAQYNTTSGSEEKSEVVLRTTESLVSGTTYRVTASAQITDIDGNPVESGSTDSATFGGFNGTESPESSYTPTSTDDSQETTGTTTTTTGGDKEISLDDLLNQLDDGSTSGEEGSQQDLENVLNVTSSSGEEDVTPPEDVTNLVDSIRAQIDKWIVTLAWTPSINSAGDLSDQILYRSLNRGTTWAGSSRLGKDARQVEIPENPNTTVAYKITTTDIAGNESAGIIRIVNLPALPATGGGVFLLGMSALAGGLMRLRRKK